MTTRSTTEVFEDHLTKRLAGDVEGDITQNYAEDVVILTGTGAFHGNEGVCQSAAQLSQFIPESAAYEYKHTLIVGEYAFLEWTAQSSKRAVCDGADGFVIKDGKIIYQTIHYSVQKEA